MFELTWDELFEQCNNYRKKNDDGDQEYVILLTEVSNDKNWFSAADPGSIKNFFVQTSHWDFFIPGERNFR